MSEYISDSDGMCTLNATKTAHCLNKNCTYTHTIPDEKPLFGHEYNFYPEANAYICQNCDNQMPENQLNYSWHEYGVSYYVSSIGTFTDKDIIIPSSFEGFPVVGIGYEAFLGCTEIESVTIPHSVTYIYDRAFGSCTALKSVFISDSVETITHNPFELSPFVTIFCKSESKPEDWNENWDTDGFGYLPIIWGYGKDIKGDEITAEQWAQAVNYANYANANYEVATICTGAANYVRYDSQDNNKNYYLSRSDTERVSNYACETDGKYFLYNLDEEYYWETKEISTFEISMLRTIPFNHTPLRCNISDFTYDQTTGKYVYNASEFSMLISAEIAFKDGKIISLKYSEYTDPDFMDESTMNTFTVIYSYDNEEIILPETDENHFENKKWTAAFEHTNYDNFTVTVTHEQFKSTDPTPYISEKEIRAYDNGKAHIRHNTRTESGENYYTTENGEYFRFDKNGETWSKTEITEDDFDGIAFTYFYMYVNNYSAFTYNEENDNYVCNNLPAIGHITDGVDDYVTVYFKDGKPVKVEEYLSFYAQQEDYYDIIKRVITFTYGNADITIPNV
ncbi:MAG: leucine-rich repeat domain-containing protein [Clostridia bacterium]|nr:leucine-rich repeat domain-containing protein [Clostridia bacterium]